MNPILLKARMEAKQREFPYLRLMLDAFDMRKHCLGRRDDECPDPAETSG
jgi:hypothetical protein